MAYERNTEKLRTIIRESIPEDQPPRFTPQQIERFRTASEVILGLLAVGGLVTVALVAPNAVAAIDKIFFQKTRRKLSKKERDHKITQAFYYLKRSGLIRMKPNGGDFKVWLTELGKKRLGKLDFANLKIPSPRAWNKKWWLVAADVPTKKHKLGADLFRRKLKQMSFYPLQRTLWLYPHDPRKELEYVSNYYGIGRFVTAMEINRLDRDDEEKVKEYFRQEGIIKKPEIN